MTRAIALLLLLVAPSAAAQTLPTSSSVGHVVEPTPSEPASVSIGAGYGFTESIIGQSDAHHRLTGVLAASARLLPWLSAGVRLDGRYDAHEAVRGVIDDGWVGDPRLFVQIDRPLGRARIGARLGLWLPGATAPSVVSDAASFELCGLAAYTPRGSRLSLSAHAGYRVDRSAAAAPDGMLAAGDRLALGASDFDAVLLGLGASVRAGRATILVHAGADLLVGDGAPPASESPIRVAAGVRVPATPSVDLEAMATVSPAARPAVDATAPLVPVEPLFAFTLGVTMRFGSDEPPPARASRPTDLAAPPPVDPVPPPALDDPVPPALPPGQIRGVIRAYSGEPVAAKITVLPGDERAESSATDGTFEIDVPPGDYEVVVEAAGYQSQRRKIQVVENGVTVLNVDLRRRR